MSPDESFLEQQEQAAQKKGPALGFGRLRKRGRRAEVTGSVPMRSKRQAMIHHTMTRDGGRERWRHGMAVVWVSWCVSPWRRHKEQRPEGMEIAGTRRSSVKEAKGVDGPGSSVGGGSGLEV